MELKDLIDQGSTKAGNQTALALLLGVPRDVLTHAKAGRRGLPDFACFRLAEFIDIDPAKVTAASALVTEKDEERRKVFYPFVIGRAAAIIVTTALIGTTALPRNAEANQLLNMPSTWANLHYVKLLRRMYLRFMFQIRMPLVFSFA